ncbi:Cell number regulator 13 [Dionaea muscipula]
MQCVPDKDPSADKVEREAAKLLPRQTPLAVAAAAAAATTSTSTATRPGRASRFYIEEEAKDKKTRSSEFPLSSSIALSTVYDEHGPQSTLFTNLRLSFFAVDSGTDLSRPMLTFTRREQVKLNLEGGSENSFFVEFMQLNLEGDPIAKIRSLLNSCSLSGIQEFRVDICSASFSKDHRRRSPFNDLFNMASAWDTIGELSNIVQLTGLDAVRLIGLIVKASTTARMHKKNCRQFAQHLKLIGNLLEQLKISELRKYPETREPLEQFEDALRRAYILVNSCQERSYLYLLAMGWNIVYQFRRAQNEIDRYLKLVPLMTLVDNNRVRERLEHIEMDQHEYTLDEEDEKAQVMILNPEHCVNSAAVLKKTLSCSYPNCSFNVALQKESEKLRLELERSQANLDVGQCEVIRRLIDVTETAAASCEMEKSSSVTVSKNVVSKGIDNEHSFDETYSKKSDTKTQRTASSASSARDLLSPHGSYRHEKWHSDLLSCCSEPCLCLKTFFFPCGTFSRIATVANGRYVSSAEACNDLLAYSLILSCCCYTCCVRRKLRKMLNITGGGFDDFLSHLMCCCCALVQEWREVEIRGVQGMHISTDLGFSCICLNNPMFGYAALVAGYMMNNTLRWFC